MCVSDTFKHQSQLCSYSFITGEVFAGIPAEISWLFVRSDNSAIRCVWSFHLCVVWPWMNWASFTAMLCLISSHRSYASWMSLGISSPLPSHALAPAPILNKKSTGSSCWEVLRVENWDSASSDKSVNKKSVKVSRSGSVSKSKRQNTETAEMRVKKMIVCLFLCVVFCCFLLCLLFQNLLSAFSFFFAVCLLFTLIWTFEQALLLLLPSLQRVSLINIFLILWRYSPPVVGDKFYDWKSVMLLKIHLWATTSSSTSTWLTTLEN